MACLESLMACLQHELDYNGLLHLKDYSNTSILDGRQLIQRKSIKTNFNLDNYTQVFQNKHGLLKT